MGERGTLLLDSAGRVAGFLPGGNKTLTVTVSEAAANAVTDDNGKKYSIQPSAGLIVYGEYSTWELGFADLYSGCTAKLYYTAGGVVDLVYVSSASSDDSVYVATAIISGGVNPFEAAFGLKSGRYSILKNGAISDESELAQYDVATYDAATSTLIVSDFKLTATWKDAYPNASAPSTVTLMGHVFEVLDSVSDDFGNFALGRQITVLLTADMKVAAVYATSKVKADSPIGILDAISGDSCKTTLTNGLSLSGTLVSNAYAAEALVGSLVSVSGTGSGLSVSALSYSGADGKWNVSAGTVGDDELSAGAKIYERVGNGPVTQISVSEVLVSAVSADAIDYVGYNSAGRIALMVLNDVTGDRYTYGIATAGTQSSDSQNISQGNKTVYVTNSNGRSDDLVTGKTFSDGAFIGIAGTAQGKLAGYVSLSSKKNITRDDFTGTEYVAVGDYLVPISEDVQVYNSSTEAWTTLSLAKAYAESFTVYYDKTPATGGKIRIIVF